MSIKELHSPLWLWSSKLHLGQRPQSANRLATHLQIPGAPSGSDEAADTLDLFDMRLIRKVNSGAESRNILRSNSWVSWSCSAIMVIHSRLGIYHQNSSKASKPRMGFLNLVPYGDKPFLNHSGLTRLSSLHHGKANFSTWPISGVWSSISWDIQVLLSPKGGIPEWFIIHPVCEMQSNEHAINKELLMLSLRNGFLETNIDIDVDYTPSSCRCPKNDRPKRVSSGMVNSTQLDLVIWNLCFMINFSYCACIVSIIHCKYNICKYRHEHTQERERENKKRKREGWICVDKHVTCMSPDYTHRLWLYHNIVSVSLRLWQSAAGSRAANNFCCVNPSSAVALLAGAANDTWIGFTGREWWKSRIFLWSNGN